MKGLKMANWYGKSRSNYFRVKDADAFKKVLKQMHGLTIIEQEDNTFMLYVDGENDGAWPYSKYVEDEHGNEEEIDIDIAEEIFPHLVEGEVAIFLQIGSEKFRCLTGWAQAVNSKGEQEMVNINDIYTLVEDKLGAGISRAEY
jgi:hypothetical protein